MSSDSPREGLSDFFDFVYGSAEGYAYFPTKAPDGEFRKVMYEWPTHKTNAISHILKASAEGKDVFFGPALFSKPNPEKENVKGAHVLWADFDGNAPGDDTWETGDEPTGGAPGLSVPPPSLRIQSSQPGHEHLYWRLEEFDNSREDIEARNRAIAYTLGADTSGWDANQILRPPFTTNYKRNLPVTIEEESDRTYGPASFASLRKVKELISEQIDTAKLPSIEDVFARSSPWSEDALDLFHSDASTGVDRSSALMRLGYFAAENGLSDVDIYAILLDADDRWGKFKHRNDRQKRLTDIVNRARQKHPRALGDLTFGGLLGTESAAAPVNTNQRVVYGFADLVAAEFNIDWLVDGLIARGSYGILSSAPGVGKTQLLLRLLMSCALGQSFVGYQPQGRMKVGFLGLEMGPVHTKHFVAQMAKSCFPSEMETLQRNMFIAPLGEPLPFDRPEGKKFIEALLEEHKPDILGIDAFGKMTLAELNDEKMIRQIMTYIQALRVRYGVAICLIHHNRKASDNNKKPKDLSDIYGSQYITTDADFAISLWREAIDSQDIEVREVKNRLAVQRSPFLIARGEHINFFETGGEDELGKEASGTFTPPTLPQGGLTF